MGYVCDDLMNITESFWEASERVVAYCMCNEVLMH